MATLTDLPERTSTDGQETLRGRLRGLSIAVVVMAIALLGLGAWVVYDFVTDGQTAPTGEVQALLDDYTAAWNDHDGAAFLELVTENYTFSSGSMETSAEGQAMLIRGYSNIDIERIGQPIMVGDGPWDVVVANRLNNTNADTYEEGISFFVIVDQDGTLLVSSHDWTGE